MAEKVIDWKSCQQKEFNNVTTPFQSPDKFNVDCAPEVIYTWREDVSLAAMVESQKKGVGPVASHPNKKLFLSKTPLSSHMYGVVGVRIKLKKDAKFVSANISGNDATPQRNCKYYEENLPKDEYDKMVLVSNLPSIGGFSEYILCSDGAIESWSYGTPEHLKEEEKEIAYIKEHPEPGQHESIIPSKTLANPGNKGQMCVDYKDCSWEALIERMDHHRQLAKENKGEIFYMPGTEKDPAQHFDTEKKFYYSVGNKGVYKAKPKPQPQPPPKWKDLLFRGTN